MNRSYRALAFAVLGASCATAPSAAEKEQARAALYADVLSARYAELAADSPIAADRLLRALEATPFDEDLLDRAVAAALDSGDFNAALAAARLGARNGATASSARLVLAVDALAEGQPADASHRLEGAGGAPFERIAARIVRAHALAELGRTDEALALVSTDQGPAGQVLGFVRGLINEQAGRTDAALAAYAGAAGEGVRLAAAGERRGLLLERLGRRDEAAVAYRAVLAEVDNPGLEARLAALRAGSGAGEQPRLAAREAAGESLTAIALALLAPIEPEAATPLLALALRLDPGHDVARVSLAESLAEGGQIAEARAALALVKPNSAYAESAQIRAAWLLQEEDRLDAAIAAAEAAAASGGRRALAALADLYRIAERWSDAERVYTQLLGEGVSPEANLWRLYFFRGAARERLGAWPGAEADLQRSLELSPEQPEVMNYLGYSWIDRGLRLKEGFELIERAVALRPSSGHIIDSLGWAHYRLGDYEAALTHLERAAELTPGDPTINDHLGDVYWRLGRKLEAGFQWRRALSLKPAVEERLELERKLAEGLPAGAPGPLAGGAGQRPQ